jgi:hypothetical protein
MPIRVTHGPDAGVLGRLALLAGQSNRVVSSGSGGGR